jgi:glutamyl-tRNA reductase
MNRLLLLGLNHATAPLAVREQAALDGPQRRKALAALAERFPGCEGVLLSTCNRVELYVAGPATPGEPGGARAEELIAFLAGLGGLGADAMQRHLYQKRGRAVVSHLFEVAASLDSMVVGETQILGQVREAYETAQSAGMTGAMLNPLFQRALAVGKLVMHETAIGEGKLSVASAAVDYARQIFDQFGDKTVLSIGAGKMAALVLRHFADLRPGKLLVCNRDAGKAEALAEQFGGIAAPFERLGEHLTAADIVVSSTGSAKPIITREGFEALVKARRYRPIFLIDIALPRDVEAAVGELENVYLYNIDDLQQVVAQTQEQRGGAVAAAREIVQQHVTAFARWHQAREMGPAIDQLRQRYHAMAREELQRTLNKLPNISDEEKAHLEELSRRLVNKLLHAPLRALREAEGGHAGTGMYWHAMEKLFGLEEQGEEKREDGE